MRSHSLPSRAAGALAATVLLAGALAVPAFGWLTAGHSRVAMAAVEALPRSMPSFFRNGGWSIGQAAVDPDLMKDKQLPALGALVWPDHFLDSELLQGAPLPADRSAFIDFLQSKHLTLSKVGTLPYAILEHEQELTMTFAEYRRWPHDPAVQQRALVYAGWLAHYAGDLEQPLHTTVDHDGRALPDGSSPFTGIHFLVDEMFEKAPLDVRVLVRGVRPRAFPDAWSAILAELATSHGLVDDVYRLEPDLRASLPAPPPRPAAPTTAAATSSGAAHAAAPPVPPQVLAPPSKALRAFVDERFRSTASFIASLYLTAWERSASLQLPSWDHRPGPGRWDVGRND